MARKQITKKLLPDHQKDFEPTTIEIVDEYGKLLEIRQRKIVYQGKRPKGHKPQIVCWFFDGKSDGDIAYLHTPNAIILNRISQMPNQLPKVA